MNLKEIMNKEIKINGIAFTVSALIYVYISVIIFLVGWVKPIFSVVTIIAIIFGFYYYLKNGKKKPKEDESICIKIKMLIFVVFITIIVGNIIGWTGIFKQAGDWNKHNAVLADLTTRKWPVVYNNGNEKSMLTYYLGQYMFPSLIGKIFSSNIITQITNGFWAMIGLLFVILGVFKNTKSNTSKKQFITLLIFLFFSSCLVISQYFGRKFFLGKGIIEGNWFINSKEYKLQFSPNIVCLRWVMPQCLVIWIIMCILYDNKYDLRNYAFLCLPALFYSTLPFLALIPILITLAVIKLIKEKDKKEVLKEIFSLSNIILFLTLGVILATYFMGNVVSEKPDNVKFHFVKYESENIFLYFFFIMSFIPYTILLFKSNKREPLYWISTIILLLLPFGKMGIFNDLVMRVSIIPLFIYMILCINNLYDINISKIMKVLLIVFLMIGSCSSFQEFKVCTELQYHTIFSTLEDCANRELFIQNDLKYNYYSYDLENNIFYKFIAKTKK